MGGAGEGTAFVHQALLKALDRAPGYAPEMDPIAMDWKGFLRRAGQYNGERGI
jgi:hypothetical protein